jgi:phosphatidylglycerophosphatase A
MQKTGFGHWFEELGVAWATFFYTGKSPKAPGTCGSLAALPLAWWAWSQGPATGWAVTVLVFMTGTLAARAVIKRTGNTDHQSIVIDEVVGICITTSVAAPVWWQYGLAFLLFRLFDIWKPWPVRAVDRKWKSALGTMMDDVVAAVMATVVLWVVLSDGHNPHGIQRGLVHSFWERLDKATDEAVRDSAPVKVK